MAHVRAKIALGSQKDAMKLVTIMSGQDDIFSIENFEGNQKANAKSMLGVQYAMSDYGNEMYLVNDSNDGMFPFDVDRFRA